jgi:hypothetical protein
MTWTNVTGSISAPPRDARKEQAEEGGLVQTVQERGGQAPTCLDLISGGFE